MNILNEIEEWMTAGSIRCAACLWISKQTPEDQQQWDHAMNTYMYTTAGIGRVMRARGFEYSNSTIAAHRKGKHR